MDWYYSESLKKYISFQPLKNERIVLEAAKKLNIVLDWDEYGNIINITYIDSRRIADEIGAMIMSPVEFWTLYAEAEKENNLNLINSLMSDEFTEMLDRVYLSDSSYIDHPIINSDGTFSGTIIKEDITVGRPGWILTSDIDVATGHPKCVRKKDNNSKLIKYWSPDTNVGDEKMCIPIRGFVTSVNAPSLDLGIPIMARNPKQMVRFCYENPPSVSFSTEELEYINSVFSSRSTEQLIQFSKSKLFSKARRDSSPECIKIREQLFLKLGEERIKHNISSDLLIKYNELCSYVNGLKASLNNAILNRQNITFVCGHRNPDTDTVVSSLFEAYRLSIENEENNVLCFPLVQSDRIPLEIEEVLGTELSSGLLLETDINLNDLLKTGLVRFVYTDQNYQPDLQRFVVLITDHHQLSNYLEAGTVSYPINIQLIGSCTALIYMKYCGMGYSFDKELSTMLYGAMLMDTECRVEHKMTTIDNLIMNKVKEQSGVIDDVALYEKLMTKLVSEKNIDYLYSRDYKRFKGFGFATLKMMNVFEDEKYGLTLQKIFRIGQEDNLNANLYFTLVKITEYCNDGIVINKERFYFVWNKTSTDELKSYVKGQIVESIQKYFSDPIIKVEEDYVEVSGLGKQVSRKQVAPDLEKVVSNNTKYVWFESINKWVSRDFLRYEEWMKSYAPNAICSKDGHLCNVTFSQAKKILEKIGGSMLSLTEFWEVFQESEKKNDKDFLASMTSGDFIEFLDSISVDGTIYSHPVFFGDTITGDVINAEIIEATPGLISTDEIDVNTGLPYIIHKQSEDDNKLWRYWSPPQEGTYIFSRSHIFLINRPCLDAKLLMDEAFMNMGIRVVMA